VTEFDAVNLTSSRHALACAPQGTSILLVEQNALMALEVANRGYVLETGHVALADEAKALARNEQVRKTYLSETEPPATRYDFGTNCFVSDTRTCQAERALLVVRPLARQPQASRARFRGPYACRPDAQTPVRLD
jgi:hypothetical protein